MADKLAVWQQALVHLGAAPIPSLTADVHSVNVFSNAWPGVVEEAFLEGDWNFAKSTVELVISSEVPALGYTYAYDYPADYERTVWVSPIPDGYGAPFFGYVDQGGLIHSNTAPLYLRYIRNDLTADGAIPSWPTFFWRFVAAKLAFEACERITQSTTSEQRLERKYRIAMKKARSVDARNQGGAEPPAGSWIRARRGGYRGRSDGGGIVAPANIILQDGDV